MKAIQIFCLLGVVAFACALSEGEYKSLFEAFTRQHKKQYHDHLEYLARYQTFKRNYDYIEAYNANKTGVTLKMNKFGDYTKKEYLNLLGTRVRSRSSKVHKADKLPNDLIVDWRTKGVITGVKDQGQCGSCWAFSVTGTVEGFHAITTGKLVSLSEQQLLDCSWKYGNEGCDGGDPKMTLQYVVDTKIDTEKSYPYRTSASKTCRFSPASVGANITGYVNVTEYSESDLSEAVQNKGPVSIAIDAGHDSFQFYSFGIYNEPACGKKEQDLDHAVLAVGYNLSDHHKGSGYWIVKNSWGDGWGMSGYMNMLYGSNMCGVATYASYPF